MGYGVRGIQPSCLPTISFLTIFHTSLLTPHTSQFKHLSIAEE
jgi:hypothetical protein